MSERPWAEMLDTIYEKTQVLIRRILILPGRAEIGRRQHVAMLDQVAREIVEAHAQVESRRGQIAMARDLLPKATASGTGAMLDAAGNVIGISSESADAAAQPGVAADGRRRSAAARPPSGACS